MFEVTGIHFLLGLGLIAVSVYFLFVLHEKGIYRAAFLGGYILLVLGIAETNVLHPYWNVVLMASWFVVAVSFYIKDRKERGK